MVLIRPGRADITTTRSASATASLEVMGDEDHGLALLLPQLEQLVLQDQPRLRVERTERLVHEHDFGIVDQRADNIGALAHAAGELVRIAVLEAVEPDAVDEAQRAFAPLGGRTPRSSSGNSTFCRSVRQG